MVDSITLPPVLDGQAAAGLIARLRPLRGSPLSLDAGEVRRLGGQGLQALLSARATWAADETPFSLDNPSDAFSEAWTLYGAPAFSPMDRPS